MDDATWNQWMNYRQIVLSANQPIEFYVRVLDETGQPIEGAKLSLTLSRMNENIFSMTNFPHWQAADAAQHLKLDFYSNTEGWIKFTGVTGDSLWVESLQKEGYTWTMPQIGSFLYKPGGQHQVGYDGMDDAFDPAKGYIFHMQKEDGK